MTVKVYVNWETEEIVSPMTFQKLCELKQNELEEDEYLLEKWTGKGDVLLSVSDLFWASPEELEDWRMKYFDYCRELAEEMLLEDKGWQEKEIDI